MTNLVIQRFKDSLDEQIDWDRQRARNRSRSAHNSRVRPYWVRELGHDEFFRQSSYLCKVARNARGEDGLRATRVANSK